MYIQDVYARVRLSWGGDWNEHGHGRWARGSGMGSDASRKVEKELKPEMMAEDRPYVVMVEDASWRLSVGCMSPCRMWE